MRAPEPVPGDGIASLLDDILSGEGVSRDALHGAFNDVMWAIGGSLNARPDLFEEQDGAARRMPDFGRYQPPFPPFPPRGAPPPPPVVDHQLEARQKARRVLGFADGQPITAELVKARHRELARKYHPDVAGAGSVAKMQEINHAVDLLMEAL